MPGVTGQPLTALKDCGKLYVEKWQGKNYRVLFPFVRKTTLDVIWAMALRTRALAAHMSMLPAVFPLQDVFRCSQKQVVKCLNKGITRKKPPKQ